MSYKHALPLYSLKAYHDSSLPDCALPRRGLHLVLFGGAEAGVSADLFRDALPFPFRAAATCFVITASGLDFRSNSCC
jgi:hypothetical protein